MRRPTLSTKLLAAALPLIIAVAALLAITVRSDLNHVQRAESGAELGGVWEPLISALTAVESETTLGIDSMSAATDVDPQAMASARRGTDTSINDLRTVVDELGARSAAGKHVTSGRSALSAARRNIDMASMAPDMQGDVDPIAAYALASRELVAVGQLLPSEAGEATLGRELLAVVKLAEAKLKANDIITNVITWQATPTELAAITTARNAFAEMEATLGEFEAIAPEEWAARFRQGGFPTELARFRGDLDSALRTTQAGETGTFDLSAFQDLVDENVIFQGEISRSIVDRANVQAAETRRASLIRIGIILGAVLLAGIIALMITRSITRRIRAVSAGARQVATEQLPALVAALSDPRGKSILPDIDPIPTKGSDELSELAHSFNSMQGTLVDVAHEQVEVLRRGVSDIFVTMARRNRSLIDRQLAMLDEYEASVDDSEVLSNYYQLDHLATRMRRNSESLLVLANAEPKRRRVKATEIDDVVRASIGEVEDYRRVQIEHLESLQVRGNVVADISHLLAELLDNATSFSPPESPVRVGGRRTGDTYMLRIVDDGVGIATARLADLNELLQEPPIVGLSVESTLGMSVVSLLASKHGIDVTLSAGNPGLTVDIILPGALFGPIDAPVGTRAPSIYTQPSDDKHLVAWDDNAHVGGHPVDETFEQSTQHQPEYADEGLGADLRDSLRESFSGAFGPADGGEFDPNGRVHDNSLAAMAADFDERPPVAAGDWKKMALNLSAFRTGMAAAHDNDVAAQLEPAAPVIPAAPVPPYEAPTLPAPTTRRSEFDVPPAPPVSVSGHAQRPVSPDTARQAPQPRVEPSRPAGLPTRRPGTGPAGPDRLTDSPVAAAGDPGQLQAALSAFDNSRNNVGDALPTRAPSGDTGSYITDELATSQSRLDPDDLRERLRAFQSEFRTAADTIGADASSTSPSISPSSSTTDTHTDLGGDHR